jgi:hypothetical protein
MLGALANGGLGASGTKGQPRSPPALDVPDGRRGARGRSSRAAASGAGQRATRGRGGRAHVKSFWMLKCARISSGVFPLIMSATVLQVRSSSVLMFR